MCQLSKLENVGKLPRYAGVVVGAGGSHATSFERPAKSLDVWGIILEPPRDDLLEILQFPLGSDQRGEKAVEPYRVCGYTVGIVGQGSQLISKFVFEPPLPLVRTADYGFPQQGERLPGPCFLIRP